MNTLSSKNDSEKMSSISKDVVSSLAHAMNNANEILLLVTKDQSSISQTLKMVEEDESPSSLRWYVYPKVRKGKKNVNKANANKGNCIQLIIECLDN